MTKKITDTIEESRAILGHTLANKDNVKALWAWNANDLGVTFKTNPADFFEDLGTLVGALSTRATDATAEHGAVKLDVGEHSAFASEAIKAAHTRAAKCRSAIQNCYGTATAQRVFGRGKTPETAVELAVFLKRAVEQLGDAKASWVVECQDVVVDPKVMATSLDKLRAEMEEESKKHSAQKGDVSVQKTRRDNLGTRLRNARNGLRAIAEGILTLLGDLDGAKHIALHRHAAPAVGTPDTPVVPPAPKDDEKPKG